jgi:hypothetical protein
MKFLIFLFVAAFSIDAYADNFRVLVGYHCDKTKDQLLLTYDEASDDSIKPIFVKDIQAQWNPWDLTIPKDDDHIKDVITKVSKCRLSDGDYFAHITASPGNFNIQGRCGAWITARAEVTLGKKIIYTLRRFEKDCMDMDTPIITRVIIKTGGQSPEIITVPFSRFYQ